MSVYRRGETWWFYFRSKGRRFRRSTGTTDKSLAQRIEARARLEAAEQWAFPKRKEMSWAEALLKYWDEHGQYLPSAYTISRQIKKLRANFDVSLTLSATDDAIISDYVATRRGQKARNKETLISASSVNAEVRLLRTVSRRAAKSWGVAMAGVDWMRHFVSETADRRHYLTDDEQARLLEKIRPDHRAIAEFCLLTAARFGRASNLTWSDVDDHAGVVVFRNMKGKRRGATHTVPISAALRTLLAAQRGQHPIYVFTYVCAANRPSRLNGVRRIRGERYKFSRDGWRRVWARALKDADIRDFRFHDTRHTALSRITRKAGLAVAGKLADHKDIKTTLRYAHVLDEDVLNAMNRVHESGHTAPAETDKSLDKKAN